ncbi:MAG: choice-of-anchor D domain-containing protein, partial [Verrucomicrobiaceae bacterium]
ADENPFDINLIGTGVTAPEIAITRPDASNLFDGNATIGFGSVNLGSSTAPEVLTIRNTGTAALVGIGVSLAGGHSPDFSVTAPGTTTLAPGASTTFSVVFRPSANGSRTVTIRVSSNDADENPFDLNLNGHGVAVPIIALENSSGQALAPGAAVVSFPDILVGEVTRVETIVVKNTGSATLTGLKASLSGTHGDNFTLITQGSTTLSPGASATLQVSFRPQYGGGKAASILIASSATPGAPLVLRLAGTALTRPEIAVFENSTELSGNGTVSGFGNTNVGASSKVKNITIRNTGSAPLAGLSVRSGNGEFVVSGTVAKNLPPGASTTVKITFKPKRAGARSTTLSISSNDADSGPFLLTVRGTGVSAPEIAITHANGKNLVDGDSFLNLGDVTLK